MHDSQRVSGHCILQSIAGIRLASKDALLAVDTEPADEKFRTYSSAEVLGRGDVISCLFNHIKAAISARTVSTSRSSKQLFVLQLSMVLDQLYSLFDYGSP